MVHNKHYKSESSMHIQDYNNSYQPEKTTARYVLKMHFREKYTKYKIPDTRIANDLTHCIVKPPGSTRK